MVAAKLYPTSQRAIGHHRWNRRGFIGSAIAAPSAVLGYAIVVDSKANGTDAGNLTSTRQTRDLTLVQSDDGVGVTLSSNQVTLPTGDYILLAKASSIGVNNYIRTWIYDVTNTADLVFNISTHQIQHSEMPPAFAFVSIGANTTYEIQQQASANVVDGLGFAFSSGDTEIYSTLEIWKVA